MIPGEDIAFYAYEMMIGSLLPEWMSWGRLTVSRSGIWTPF
ncbi:Uncharacterised protein [Actinomyces viscosus]|uniref:Uncharacterized protein n=2 Tax=Actinomyces viscosus TaxID=1656 RepID=A0A448PJG1_ACTVI|nr:Uncharacterised protein [Actinomyces viscosus]